MEFFRFGLYLNSNATDIVLVTLPSTAVETAIAQCTSRCAMARGHRLNTSVVLAAVHGLSGLFRAVSAVEPSLFRPLAPKSPSQISHLASVDVKKNGLCSEFHSALPWPWSGTFPVQRIGARYSCEDRSRKGDERIPVWLSPFAHFRFSATARAGSDLAPGSKRR